MARTVVNQDVVNDSLPYLISERQSTCDVACFGLCINRCTNCTLANCVVGGNLDLCRVGTVNGGNLVLGNITVAGDVISRSSGGNLFQIVFGNFTVDNINVAGDMNLHTSNGRPSVYGGNLRLGNVTIDGDLTIGVTVPAGNCPGSLINVVTGGGTINCDECPNGCGFYSVNGALTVGCRLPVDCDCRAYCADCGQ